MDDDGNPATDPANDDADPATPDGADCNGHGTHIAGTIAAAGYGVAKRATLWSQRVSLGGAPSTALDDAVRGAVAAGVVCV